MSTAQSSSPTGDLEHLFPSPTYSDSTSSASSLLCTPGNDMDIYTQASADRLHLHKASISAANAAYVSATNRENASMNGDASGDASMMFAHSASGGFDADMSSESHSLAAALDFDHMNVELHQSFDQSESFSLVGKRPNTSHPNMLHVRADSGYGRRHSIQPLMPSTDSSSSLADFSGLVGPNVGARSMSISVDAFGSFAFNAPGPHPTTDDASAHAQGVTSGTGFLMSPPRLTVSMSSANSPTPTPFGGIAEDTKRRRTSEVDATPERSVEQLTQQQRLWPQQTPPNMFAYQQHPQFSVESSVGGGLETPCSVQSSTSPCRVRRLSLTAMDRAAHIASLTANLTLPQSGGEHVPKSAPPRAASDAMQRAQSQSSLSKKLAGSRLSKLSTNGNVGAQGDSNTAANGTPNSNSKNQDVWPDDVEVAFWEGKYSHASSRFPHSVQSRMHCRVG